MKIGIIGVHYGHIGGMFRSAVNASNGALVGIVESDDTLYEKYTRDQSIPRFTTLEDLLSKAQPDLVLEGLAHHEKVEAIETEAYKLHQKILEETAKRKDRIFEDFEADFWLKTRTVLSTEQTRERRSDFLKQMTPPI